jgi:hypothetical protein
VTRNLVVFLMFAACNRADGCGPETQEHADKRWAQEKWEAPCSDEATLLASTAGSPDHFKCPNKNHVMRVQVSTTPSHEEIGALVFCECARIAPEGGK